MAFGRKFGGSRDCVWLWGECYEILTTTNLDFSGTYIGGEIPQEIGQLTSLRFLQLSNCGFTGEIPREIGNLTGLYQLFLNFNELTGPIPSEIGNLTELINLGLDGNQLTGVIPPTIGNMTDLEGLFVVDQGLTGSIPSSIGNLTNLKYLKLQWNQLTGEIPSSIGNLTNLRDLFLYQNQLSGVIPESICDINPDYLSVANNQLCPPYPDCIDIGYQDTSSCGGGNGGNGATLDPDGSHPFHSIKGGGRRHPEGMTTRQKGGRVNTNSRFSGRTQSNPKGRPKK